MDMSNARAQAAHQSSYSSHVQVASVNISSKPTDPAGNGTKVDFTVIEDLWQTFAIKAQGISELSVSFQMQPRPLQQYTPQYYSNVGTSSTAYTAPAPAPPQYTQMPPAPFAASFISTQHAQGGDKEHESTSTQDLPPPPVNTEKALKNATGVPPVLTDIRNDAGGQSKSESSSRQLSEETKPERTPAFSSTPSQTVNLQTNSSLLGTAPPGVLSTAGKSGGLIGSGSGSLFSQGVNPPPPPANNGKINNDTALAHVSSGSSSSPTSVTSSTSALFSSLSSTTSTNTKDAKPERTPAFRSTSSRTVDPQTDSSLFGATPPGILANAGKVGSLIGSGSGSLFNQRAYPPPATKGNLWTMASVNNSTAPVQVLSESSSPSFITSTKPTPSLASLSSSASVGVAGHSPSLVFSSDPWPAPRPLGRGQIGPGFPTQSRHSTSTRVVPEFPIISSDSLQYKIPAFSSRYLRTPAGPFYIEKDYIHDDITCHYQSRGDWPGMPDISHEVISPYFDLPFAPPSTLTGPILGGPPGMLSTVA